MPEKEHYKRGFTAFEFMISLAVISILFFFTSAIACKTKQKAVEARLHVDIHEIKTALEEYNLDHGTYPPAGIENLVNALRPYIKFQPKYLKDGKFIDPWGNPYIYYFPSKNGRLDYDLYSLGKSKYPY